MYPNALFSNAPSCLQIFYGFNGFEWINPFQHADWWLVFSDQDLVRKPIQYSHCTGTQQSGSYCYLWAGSTRQDKYSYYYCWFRRLWVVKGQTGAFAFFVCAILGAYLINSRIRLPRKRRGTYSATNLTISLSTLLSVTVLLTILAMREYNAII